MISRISGTLREKRENSVIINVSGISYEVFIPDVIMKVLDGSIGADGKIELVTYHYLQMDPSRGVPFLVGFLNEVEKEFFEKFITVSGVGPKAAIRALALPISVIAKAIDENNLSLLKSLPGVGERKAREIVAKLQGKVGKFGLMQDGHISELPKPKDDIQNEALDVLLQLQYKRNEAKEMVSKAISRNPDIKTSEELLNEIYKQRKLI
ncbi:MAG: Holliday junction DNA helicase RuvA [Candidatus Omnitrophica bacterium CG07_land_8_20_14_0_80_42_15]|uniref:Holliday junction branch migration complex subunit RuvA n=1 Tax=Candidatus Aquitaenariimonas noxiae TaxID=1974741 RepID=A0A2J0L1I2_9BACT|nr:MAG: Holliday junction DNA helicase RuvA [Candidatus Omnitrophica bacterium CG07_land_8_20_14_0_80_42_15]